MGFGLKMGGYISSVGGNTVTQPQSAIEAIHSMQFWPTIIASLIGIVLMLFYRLDGKTMEKVSCYKKSKAGRPCGIKGLHHNEEKAPMHIEPHGCLFYFRYLLLTTEILRFP